MIRSKLILTATVVIAGVLLPGCDAPNTPGAADVQLVFGETGMGPDEFSYPRAAVFGPDGCIYIVDKAARIQCYNTNGEFVRDWRMPVWDAGKPTGLGVDKQGRIYAADTHYARVLVFEPDGTPAGQFGTRGRGPGQFEMPTDVAVNDAGEIYVAEYGGNDRISKFTPEFEYILSFGEPGSGESELQRPQSLLVVADGSLWVADACNHRLCHFSPEGELLETVGNRGNGPGQLQFPYGIDQLSDGSLVVCEYGNNRLQRFMPSGESVGTWGRAGRKTGQLAYPWAVEVAPDDRLFIIDSGNNRVQIINGADRGAWRRP